MDWRFLLANPRLDRVAYVGRPDGGCLASLRSFCRSVEMLDSDGAKSGGDLSTAHEVVVACEPSRAELQLAARRVKSGGTLVVETRGAFDVLAAVLKAKADVPRSWRHWRLPGRLAREISRLGFEDARPYWHWPTFDQCTQIIPLDDFAAVRCALSRASRGALTEARALMGRLLLELGMLGWTAGCVSIIGRLARREQPAGRLRAGPGARRRVGNAEALTRGPNIIDRFLDEHWDRLELGRYGPSRRLSFVLLTPHFRNSSHLVFLLLGEGESEPVLVAKLPRLPGPCTKTEREAQVLRQVQDSRPGGFDSVPRVVAYEACGDHMILLETATRGSALDRVTVRRAPRRSCEATLAWLTEIQRATRHAPDSAAGWFERLIGRQLSELEATFPTEYKLVARTRGLILPLSTVSLALVLEHGDLSHPNLLVDPGGRIAVLDWELAETQGLPVTDLFFFLAYVARAQAGAQSTVESVAAVDRAFLRRRSWAREYVRRYAHAMALPQDTLTPLFIACWARQVSGLVRRMADGGEGTWRSPGSAADWVHQDWRLAVWRHAVERADQLCWDDLPL